MKKSKRPKYCPDCGKLLSSKTVTIFDGFDMYTGKKLTKEKFILYCEKKECGNSLCQNEACKHFSYEESIEL